MEQRRAFRYPTDLDADCRAGERAWSTRLRNISSTGCMIESPDPGFDVGSPMKVWIRGVPTIEGAIAWQHRGHAGIRFALPLSSALMAKLGFSPSEPSRAPATMRRGSGLHAQMIKRAELTGQAA